MESNGEHNMDKDTHMRRKEVRMFPEFSKLLVEPASRSFELQRPAPGDVPQC
jgi:hypothetical protein